MNVHASHTTRRPATIAQNVFGFILTQMTARAGIKKHGQAARDALTAEFAQLDYKGAYEPIHSTSLAETQQNSALRIINLTKEKRNGLYLSQQGRPDIRTTIAFLCSQSHNPDEDDYKKLTRMIRYLFGMKDLILTLHANNDGVVWWWIDASYAVHDNMKGHTGAALSLGKGGIYSGSWKQRLVARSSMESELVGVYDVLPQILWTKQFLEEQGWLDSANVVYQDNTSSILLEKNRKEWEKLKYETYKTHEHQILLCHGTNKKESHSRH